MATDVSKRLLPGEFSSHETASPGRVAWEALRQPVLCFGIGMIALLWLGVAMLLDIERQSSRNAVQQDTANFARVFEENVIRSVSEIDKTLRYLRLSYELTPTVDAWPGLVRQAFAASDTTLQLGVIGANGRLAASTRGPQPPKPIDLSDREHFKVHANATDDRLFISKPVKGRVSKQWSVQLARRLRNADGGFGGVIVASLDPSHFTELYRSINLGGGGTVTIVGDDGVVRASGGERSHRLGAHLAMPALAARMAQVPHGTMLLGKPGSNAMRVVSYRRVRGYPLAVVVSASENQTDGSLQRRNSLYVATAAVMTIAILWAMLHGARRTMRLAQIRRALGIKSKQLEVTLENISQGVLMVDGQGSIGFLSRRCAEMLSLPRDYPEAGQSYRDLVQTLERSGEFSGIDDPLILDLIRNPAAGAEAANYERVRPDGTVLEIRSRALPDGGFVRTISDVSGRKRAEAQILKLARQDGLTELSNRAVFRQRLEEAAAHLGSGLTFAVHMLDLDRFKKVNDTYGHLIGDKLLREAAERLSRAARAGDVVARLGGDEFAIIQLNASRPEQAASLAQRVCHEMAQPFTIEGQLLSIGCSVGIALAPGNARDASDILQAADLALYAAKSSLRGTFALYDDEMGTEHWARRSLEADLASALIDDQFELHYQPIISIETNQPVAYEALVRWRHPRRGLVPPLDFIPMAEETGFIVQLGEWVIKTACNDIVSRPGDARVAVNLSPVQFHDPGLVSIIEKALEESGLSPHRLEVEITETALLQDGDLTQQHLVALRNLGVHVTLDDFGTGYSSLAYLLSYPIQTIKIDRSFVQGICEQESCSAIVKTIMTLATSLGLSTTAEGVETVEQLDMLRLLGCTEAQGFYFSKPLPANEILPPEQRSDVAPPRLLRLAAG